MAEKYSGDVWDDDAPEYMGTGNEWERMQAACKTEGYKEGLSAGEESKLQEGFNTGYKEGVDKTLSVAKLRGVLTAVLFSIRTELLTIEGQSLDTWMTRAEENILKLKDMETSRAAEDPPDDQEAAAGAGSSTDGEWETLRKSCLSLLQEINVPIPHEFMEGPQPS